MKKVVYAEAAPRPVGPYSQGILSGNFVFLSGQLAMDSSTGKLSTGGVGEQTALIMENVKAILGASGAGLSDIVKTTIFLTDMADFQEVNRVYGGYFQGEPPARSTVQVAALPLGARLEIEVIASCAERSR